MNKEKFIDCLRDPSLLQDNDIQELNQLVKRYPYFQGARALLAKVSKERNLKDAAHRISSAAVYTTDRALLKKYISDHLFFLDSREALKEEKSAPAKVPAQKTPRPPAQSKEAAKQAAPKPNAPRPESSGDRKPKPASPEQEKKAAPPSTKSQQKPVAPKAPPVSKESSSQTPPVPKKAPSKPTPAPQVEDELTDLQQSSTNLDDWIKEIHEDIEALKKSKARFQELDKKLEEEEKKKEAEKEEEDAVNAALKKVTGSKKPAPKKTSKTAKTSKSTGSKRTKKEITAEDKEAIEKNLPLNAVEEEKEEKPKPVKKKTSSKKSAAKPEEPKKEKKVKSYASLRKANQSEPEEKKPEEKKKPVKKAEPEPQPEEDTSTLKVVRRRSGKVKSTTFESVDQEKTEEENKEKIIDEFISTSPKISKADKTKLASEEDKEDLSDKSSRFQADIGTEYLAEIYVEQGKIERAISIYEKLSLKFPEKKPYFVARIEELKSK